MLHTTHTKLFTGELLKFFWFLETGFLCIVLAVLELRDLPPPQLGELFIRERTKRI